MKSVFVVLSRTKSNHLLKDSARAFPSFQLADVYRLHMTRKERDLLTWIVVEVPFLEDEEINRIVLSFPEGTAVGV